MVSAYNVLRLPETWRNSYKGREYVNSTNDPGLQQTQGRHDYSSKAKGRQNRTNSLIQSVPTKIRRIACQYTFHKITGQNKSQVGGVSANPHRLPWHRSWNKRGCIMWRKEQRQICSLIVNQNTRTLSPKSTNPKTDAYKWARGIKSKYNSREFTELV